MHGENTSHICVNDLHKFVLEILKIIEFLSTGVGVASVTVTLIYPCILVNVCVEFIARISNVNYILTNFLKSFSK